MGNRSTSLLLPLVAAASCAAAADWPQLGRDPQHTGRSPEHLGPPYKIVWTYGVAPEHIYPAAQAVVVKGRLYIGTKEGTLHAVDAKTGRPLWRHEAEGGIYHTVADSGGRVFFGGMDGCIYAVSADTGRRVWKTRCERRLGFCAAVLLAEGKVFIGSRSGRFYALNQSDGKIAWRFQCGGPVLQAAGYDRGVLAFAAEDMRLYVLDARTGRLRWKSRKLTGQSFRDNCAVIHQGRVIVRSMHTRTFEQNKSWPGPFNWGGPARGKREKVWNDIVSGRMPQEYLNIQGKWIEKAGKNPDLREMFVFDLRGGEETVVPQWGCGTMCGPAPPPAVWRDGLVVPVMFDRSTWGILDLETRRVTQVLKEQGKKRGELSPGGSGNADEHLNISVAGDTVFVLHVQEGNAQFTGSFDMNERKWTRISPRVYRGASRLGSGGFFNNNQGGGGNAGAIADGMMYHVKYQEILARQCTVKN